MYRTDYRIPDVRTCYGENSATLKEQESTLPELAKEVEDNSRYKTLEANATVLKLLVDDKNGVSRWDNYLRVLKKV